MIPVERPERARYLKKVYKMNVNTKASVEISLPLDIILEARHQNIIERLLDKIISLDFAISGTPRLAESNLHIEDIYPREAVLALSLATSTGQHP